ncbi:hypothetical protein CCACVL1_17109 [Corchorus capsularis]|uniref:Uncharacterized protein n=1 Tax=Corchorus capsularis TaxID=210143 RepID=A0A1R3HUC2_COCAP|nr:hypothetical protein CCACVL1_17109 [Corchorus capsularis]
MGRSRGSRANKQGNKFMKIVRSPIRILSKARDLYMRSVEGCAGMVTPGGGGAVCPAPPAASRLPKSFSVNSSKGCGGDDEELRRLLRAASKRQMQQQSSMKQRNMAAMRSYSVGIGRIGRIDEDKPCSFEEDDSMEDLMYSRSRSHAFRRNLIVYR